MAGTSVPATTPAVTVDGKPLRKEELENLVSLRVQRAVGLVGRATLRFVDPGYVAATHATYGLGKVIKVSLAGGDELFEGTVTGVDLDQNWGEAPVLTVTADDAAYKLARGSRQRTFQKVRFSDVVQTIASENGLSVKGQAALGSVMNEYLLQSGTDLEYLDFMVRRSGCVWWVDEKKSLVVGAASSPAGSVELALQGTDPATTLTNFSVKASGLRSTRTEVTGWDSQRQNKISSASAPEASGATSDFVAPFSGSKSALGVATALTVQPPPASVAEAKALASSLQHDAETEAVVARGTCGVNASLKPMVEVRVQNAGPSSGSYVVTEVEHNYSRRGFTTGFVAGPRRPQGLVDSLGNPPPDPGFVAHRLITGVVTNIKDPAKLGRVKVQYAGVFEQVESQWARLVTLGAGGARGITFQPEVNDEVLVGFERGDTRHPVILGGLFGDARKLNLDGVNAQGNKVVSRRLVSRLGHVIEFGDDDTDPKKQHVLVEVAKNGPKLLLGAEQCDLVVPQGKPFTLSVGSSGITIDAQGNVTIEGASITLKSKGAVKIDGLSVEAAAKTTLKLDAKAQLQASGALAEVKATGPLTIKGSMVMIN
jgi:uncharacterized protein involved in type VI secretion and phage assembly